jgi:hypothetical protein
MRYVQHKLDCEGSAVDGTFSLQVWPQPTTLDPERYRVRVTERCVVCEAVTTYAGMSVSDEELVNAIRDGLTTWIVTFSGRVRRAWEAAQQT